MSRSGRAAQTSASGLSRTLTFALPLVAAAAIVTAAVLPPHGSPWRMAAWVGAGCWAAWLVWVWPHLELHADELVVRNFLLRWRIPLAAVASVGGGRGLTIVLRDGRRVPVAAVSAGESLDEAWREGALGAENGYFDGDARGESPLAPRVRTEATAWAFEIAKRLDGVVSDDAVRVHRRLNVAVIAGSLASVAAVVAAVSSL